MERDGKIIDDKQPQAIKKNEASIYWKQTGKKYEREKRRLNQGLTEKENDLWKVLTLVS